MTVWQCICKDVKTNAYDPIAATVTALSAGTKDYHATSQESWWPEQKSKALQHESTCPVCACTGGGTALLYILSHSTSATFVLYKINPLAQGLNDEQQTRG